MYFSITIVYVKKLYFSIFWQNGEDVEIWATELALAWLSEHYTEQFDEWELIKNKADTWLKQQGIYGDKLTELEMVARMFIIQG